MDSVGLHRGLAATRLAGLGVPCYEISQSTRVGPLGVDARDGIGYASNHQLYVGCANVLVMAGVILRPSSDLPIDCGAHVSTL